MAVMRASSLLSALRRGEARPNRWLTGLGLGFFAAALALVLWWGGLFVQVRLAFDDVFAIPREPSDAVAIIAIDDASLEAYGRFSEWPRSLYADLIERLASSHARVVALDILLAEDSPDDDVLAEAIAAARISDARMRTVIASVGTQRDSSVTDLIAYQSVVQPVGAFVDAGAMVGNVNVLPDLDGHVRQVPLLFRGEDGALEPSLSYAAFLSHRGISAALLEQAVQIAPGQIGLPGDDPMPTDALGRMRVNFFSVPGQPTFDVYSFAAVLNGEVPATAFADRIVLVGLMEQTALTDSYPVPGSRDGTLMAGVEIHANAVETLMQAVPLRVQGRLAQALTIGVLALLGGVVYRVVPWRWLLPLFMLTVLAWIIFVILIYNLQGMVIGLFYSLMALVMAGVLVSIFRVVEEVFRRQRTEILLESALGAFEHNFSLTGILQGIAEDLDRMLGVPGSRGWLWDERRQSLNLAHPQLPIGEALPLSLRPWHELANEALTSGEIVSRDRRVAVPLIWHDRPIGVLTGQSGSRLALFRDTLLRRFGWQTAEMVVNAQLYEETVRLSEFKTRMIRMASHDLKNPLTRIMGYAELLQGQIAPEEADSTDARFLERIVRASEEMNGIILDLLDLEHARQGMKTAAEYDLLQVLDDVIMQAEGDVDRRQQHFTVEMPNALPRLTGEASQVRQAISNLVGNASKYTPEGGQIWLRVTPQSDRVRVAIEDTGYGIPADELPNLFQEFYRVKTDETLGISGTGLGPSLVKAVIEVHGGRVWAQSEYGKGSTFFVELPFELPEALRPAAPVPPAKPASEVSPEAAADR